MKNAKTQGSIYWDEGSRGYNCGNVPVISIRITIQGICRRTMRDAANIQEYNNKYQ